MCLKRINSALYFVRTNLRKLWNIKAFEIHFKANIYFLSAKGSPTFFLSPKKELDES